MDLAGYCRAFESAQRDFMDTAQSFGLPFEKTESCPRDRREELAGCLHENGGASIHHGWISPSCVACRTGERSETFFISLACSRDCYFCFNPNQERYEYFQTHVRDIVAELRQAKRAQVPLDHIAITGGEPCLFPDELVGFVACARELYPNSRIRLYTSGDGLDDALLGRLASAGLDEVRFSIKLEDERDVQGSLLALIGTAVGRIADVMVEMPVIPGTEAEMEQLLVRLDDLGVRGINLLEFCFPLNNAREFAQRGFTLRRVPYRVLYNYWYAGGLPIAGSEAECLGLLGYAVHAGLSLGVHYCSLDNKNTGQIYQQNKVFLHDEALRGAHAHLAFDEEGFFLVCAKVFGDDVARALPLLQELVESSGSASSILVDPSIPFVAFPLSWAAKLRALHPGCQVARCGFVIERGDAGEPYFREVFVEGLS